MPNIELTRDGPVSVPLQYTVPNGGQLAPLTVEATLDGTSTVAPWYATLQILDPNGRSMGKYISSSVAAGASADVTWFPNLISQGSTSAGATGPAVLFEQTLTGTSSGFDTGAGGVAQTHKDILILTTLVTTEATPGSEDCQVNLNNDFVGTYKDQRLTLNNTTVAARQDSPGGWECMSSAGASGDAGQKGVNALYIPNYTSASDHWAIGLQGVIPKQASFTDARLGIGVHSYVSTLAITRIAVIPNVGGGALFAAGSRCIMYGFG